MMENTKTNDSINNNIKQDCKSNCDLNHIYRGVKGKNLIIIDPGIKNLCLLSTLEKKVWLFHFNTLLDFIKSKSLQQVLTSLSNLKNLNILCEDQIVKRNLNTQGFVCGFICSRLDIQNIYRFPPNEKKTLAKNYFNFDYKKIKSNKSYLELPVKFRYYLKTWKIFETCELNLIEKSFSNFKDLKKKDDIIDCILISLNNKY
jgi:hypothetical protein